MHHIADRPDVPDWHAAAVEQIIDAVRQGDLLARQLDDAARNGNSVAIDALRAIADMGEGER